MNLNLLPFQEEAINNLLDAMNEENPVVVLKSCTGSGKTIILTHFMDRLHHIDRNTCFVWLTPGKGDLEEQSKAKMDKYVHASSTKLLDDVLNDGFSTGDYVFINWERLNKRGNNALKEGERLNFLERVSLAQDEGIEFVLVVDESHSNNTIKTNDLKKYFQARKTIHASATPVYTDDDILVEVDEDDVIDQGLIKRHIFINPDFPNDIEVSSEEEFLIDKAETMRQELVAEYAIAGAKVNPLVVIQLPDNNDTLKSYIEDYLTELGITYDNGLLACWLSGEHKNTDGVELNDSKVQYIIIKQAIAMGWDCPRAQILVKLRDNMTETFQIQTIGRIRRMPEAHHYDNPVLDNCYIFTMDTKFIEDTKNEVGDGVSEAITLFLKPEHRFFSLVSEKRNVELQEIDPRKATEAMINYYVKTLDLGKNGQENKAKFANAGYEFSSSIDDTTQSGLVEHLNVDEIRGLNSVSFKVMKTGRPLHDEFNRALYHLASRTNIRYTNLSQILRRLFHSGTSFPKKLLKLDQSAYYAFFLNNYSRIQEDITKALAGIGTMMQFDKTDVHEKLFEIPRECLFAYNKNARNQSIMQKNVYEGYRASAAGRSMGERAFEKYCEAADAIKWFYKNGDKGIEYFSILFQDNAGNRKLFYPDYIIQTNDDCVWIIEVKGGQGVHGEDRNIDEFAAMKFEAMKRYADEHHVKAGFVRFDELDQDLCIATEEYTSDMRSEYWVVLDEVFES